MQMFEGLLGPEERAVYRLRRLYAEHGYSRYRMNKFEHYDLYARNKDFLVSDSVLTFTDAGGRLLALRPDVTLSIVKAYRGGEVMRVQYNENVYRPDPATGEYKEIMQSGVECLGPIGPAEQGEVLALAVLSLQQLGGQGVLTLSHQGLVQGLLKAASEDGDVRRQLLALIGQKNLGGLTDLCGKLGIQAQAVARLRLLTTASGDPRAVLCSLREAGVDGAALSELQALCEGLENQGYDTNLRIDFSIGGDATYYDGVVFKGWLQGLPGIVLSGGRYDPLMRRMGKPQGAIGFAVYLDQLDRLSEEVQA